MKKKIPNIHPGKILKEDFIIPLGITAYQLSKATGIPQTRISQIIKGNRSISIDTAIRLGNFFDVTPEFWMHLQHKYDIEALKDMKLEVYESIIPYGKKRKQVKRK